MTKTDRLNLLMVRRTIASAQIAEIDREIERLKRELKPPRPAETVWPDQPGEY